MGICGTVFFSGFDGSLFNGLQSIDRWQEYFDHPTGVRLGLMSSAGFLPGIIAGFVGDRIGIYLGRRVTLWIGTTISASGSILMSLSTSYSSFCVGRALTGFGYGIALDVAPALLLELAHPRYRGPLSAFYTCVYYLSAILSAAACLGCMNLTGDKSWRVPCFLQLVGPGITLLMTSTVPESPRWLVKNGKSDRALAILAKYHANGKFDDPLVVFEYHEIRDALANEAVAHHVKYSDFLKGSGNRKRLAINVIIAFGTNWVGNGIISYYLSPVLATLGITSTTTQLQILVGLQCWNCGMLACLAIVMGLSASYSENGSKSVGAAAIVFLFLFYGSYDIAWTPLTYAYPAEIFPYSLRTKAQAIFLAIQTAANSVNTWVNPIALEAIAWKYYGVYVGIDLALLVIIYFLFPETKGRTIEEISSIFDKDVDRGQSLSEPYGGESVSAAKMADSKITSSHVE
ncbi:Lactose permease [Colletotrichum siamense]|nr:Lactose permease [Colletotrichum siamense]